MRRSKVVLTVILVLIAALAVGAGGWYLWSHNDSRQLQNAIEEA